MLVDKDLLRTLGVKPATADRYLPDLVNLLPRHAIDTPLRIAHFLAQVLHESGLMQVVEENLNYSANRLLAVFPKYFSPAEARAHAGNPQRIGNRVYAGRNGNGNEQSGDGYRYRGRGLIQLTGKAKYRELGKSIGTDLVAAPDLVATQLAVASAVFFWSTRACNDPADADDLVAVTRKVNGGLNGFADRRRLLERAKHALLGASPVLPLEGATHRVRATQLNLRSKPHVAPSTRIATLAQGTPLAVVEPASEPGWVRVRVVVGGQIAQGFVHGDFLEKLAAASPKAAKMRATAAVPTKKARSALAAAAAAIPAVHLEEGRPDVKRDRDARHAHPLGEPGMPRRTGSTEEKRAAQLLDIVRYLDPEKASHARYAPKTSATYCNVYAYDFCYLAGAYLPRVFWKADALARLRAGETVPVAYGTTVEELSANRLHDWLADHGEAFGWHGTTSLDVLQAAANDGEVCLIVAKHVNANSSGHVVAVVPEHGSFAAARGGDGSVLRPVESQAGRNNHRFTVKSSAWWQTKQFQSFAFWRHA